MAEKREPNPAAQELARKRWEGTTPEQRTQHARDAARKRWGPLPAARKAREKRGESG